MKSIFLHGFRCTGKSTIGAILAKHHGWEYIEMDTLLEKRAGKSITQITKHGTDWYTFRKMEHELLKELTTQTHMVVSTGGGCCVNNIFGELNAHIMQNAEKQGALSVLITASDQEIRTRIAQQEHAKAETTRPILNEQRAAEIQEELRKHEGDEQKQKEILVQAIVDDSMQIYEQRKPLYAAITSHLVDTTDHTPEQTAEEILYMVKSQATTQ